MFFKRVQAGLCVFMCLQMDLEPEGKVYIHVSLTGSFTDGKIQPEEESHVPYRPRGKPIGLLILLDYAHTFIDALRTHTWFSAAPLGMTGMFSSDIRERL